MRSFTPESDVCMGLQYTQNVVWENNRDACGTPRKSRLMCPHIRRAMPTTHHSCSISFNSVLTSWHWDSLLDFVQVRFKLRTQGFLSSELLQESSLQTCIGQLDTLVCKYTVHFHPHIVRLWNRINSQHYCYHQRIAYVVQFLSYMWRKRKKMSNKIETFMFNFLDCEKE